MPASQPVPPPEQLADQSFRGLLESAPDAIIVVNDEGVIVLTNTEAVRMFGYAREELIGQNIEILVPEQGRSRHVHNRQTYSADPRTRPMGSGQVLTGRRKGGDEFPVEISLSPLRTDRGLLVISIIRDTTERRRVEARLQESLRAKDAALAEREAMLREIHHRVKNNLQITSSLLRLQSAQIGDAAARRALGEVEHRIRSMALVHEKLYQSANLAQIDFAAYIRTLSDLLLRSAASSPTAIAVSIEGDEILLGVDAAVPCGLIVNELLSNSIKHAFPSGNGTIRVRLARSDSLCTVVIADDGVGIPKHLDLDSGPTLGMRLVRSLVQQIGGQFDVASDAGTSYSFTFPRDRSIVG